MSQLPQGSFSKEPCKTNDMRLHNNPSWQPSSTIQASLWLPRVASSFHGMSWWCLCQRLWTAGKWRGGRGPVGSPWLWLKWYQFVVTDSGHNHNIFVFLAFCLTCSFLHRFCHFFSHPHVPNGTGRPTGACQPQPEQSACGLEGFVCCPALLGGVVVHFLLVRVKLECAKDVFHILVFSSHVFLMLWAWS